MLRPPLLPEDARYMGTTIEHLRAALPALEAWLKNVFTVMGGFVAGAGVLTVFLGRTAVRSGTRGTGLTIAVAGLLTVALMGATNFALDSDFKLLLLIPPLLWLVGLVLYAMGR